MSERGILFSAPMVRALLDGRKTQTRRAIKPQSAHGLERCHYSPTFWAHRNERGCTCRPASAPYGDIGDRLIVRETFRLPAEYDDRKPTLVRPDAPVWYEADGRAEEGWGKTRVSIHMPRWASRITLEITDVRVQRLCSISGPDAEAEGLTWIAPGVWSVQDASAPVAHADPVLAYLQLWDHINGLGSAAANPWVWAVSFKRIAGESP